MKPAVLGVREGGGEKAKPRPKLRGRGAHPTPCLPEHPPRDYAPGRAPHRLQDGGTTAGLPQGLRAQSLTSGMVPLGTLTAAWAPWDASLQPPRGSTGFSPVSLRWRRQDPPEGPALSTRWGMNVKIRPKIKTSALQFGSPRSVACSTLGGHCCILDLQEGLNCQRVPL
ncbi:uncharacterized protein VK521_000708 [Ammospiza maritima maritima]